MTMKRCILGLLLMGLWITPLIAQDTPSEYDLILRGIEQNRLNGYTDLHLSDTNLTSLPPEIGQLTHLELLSVTGNSFTSLPPEIGQLTNLKVLNLKGNKLTSLPPEIGQLSHLELLSVQGNNITSLPPEIGQLSNLLRLDLSYNQLTSLPPEIGQLSKLRRLDLSYNQLTSLPAEFGQLSGLLNIDLSENDLSPHLAMGPWENVPGMKPYRLAYHEWVKKTVMIVVVLGGIWLVLLQALKWHYRVPRMNGRNKGI
jgi:hypothetical protein